MNTDQVAVDKWRGELISMLPADFRFIGRPVTFSMISTDEIVEHVMAKYDYHKNPHKEAQFGISVQCYSHYGSVCSTWIYMGCMIPHASKKKKKKVDAEAEQQQ